MVKYKARLVLQFINILGGIVIINMAYILAFFIRFQGWPPAENFHPFIIAMPFITIAAFLFLGIYGMHTNVNKSLSEIVPSVICVVFLISLSAVTVSYFFGKFAFPRSVFLISAFVQLIILSVWFKGMRRFERIAHGTKNVVVIGDYAIGYDVSKRIENDSLGLYKVKGIITDKVQDNNLVQGIPILGNYDVLKDREDYKKNNLFILCPGLNSGLKREIINYCLENTIPLYVIPEMHEILLTQSNVVQIGDILLVGFGELQINSNYKMIKRIMDIVIAGLGCLCLAVPLFLVALIIKIDSEGPVFYRQKRVGEGGRIFEIYKFRTMVEDAEKNTGPVFAQGNQDPRITRVGKFLRATRIDELPQLINVLKGEMSLVGPRPERPHFVRQFAKQYPDYLFRNQVKAGITGLAQVRGRYSTSAQDKLRYDLLYAKTYSPLSDIKILLQTFKVILMKDKSA